MIRNIILDLKKRNSVSGRTIRIADKGVNCAENIFHALENGDGYIFSKSVKILLEVEKTWVLLPNDYKDVKNANGNVVCRIKECVDDFEYNFLICCLAVLLTRLLQFKILKNNYCSEV